MSQINLAQTKYVHGRAQACLPPEAAKGKAPGPSSNVFAFGMLMYEVMFRREPYQEQELEVRMHSKEERVPSLLGQYPCLFACCYMSHKVKAKPSQDYNYVSCTIQPKYTFQLLTMQDEHFSMEFRACRLQEQLESQFIPMRRNSQVRPVRRNSMLRPKWTQAEAACFPIELIRLMQTCWRTVSSVQDVHYAQARQYVPDTLNHSFQIFTAPRPSLQAVHLSNHAGAMQSWCWLQCTGVMRLNYIFQG